MKKNLMTIYSGAYDVLVDAKNKASNEINPIANDVFKPIFGGILLLVGTVSLLWGLGQMRNGNKAMSWIIGGIVAMIAGGIVLAMDFKVF